MSARTGKQVVRGLIDEVWTRGDLDQLERYWTADCVNHAAPAGDTVGLVSLRRYHEEFATFLAAFSDVDITIEQQVEEGDRVVTQLATAARHTGEFAGVPATGRSVTLATIRIDRLRDDKIAEHWSVADVAGLLQQIQS